MVDKITNSYNELLNIYILPNDIFSIIVTTNYDNPTTPEHVEDMEKEMNLNYRSMYCCKKILKKSQLIEIFNY